METKAVMTKAITMLVGNASSAKANAKVEGSASFGSILDKSTAGKDSFGQTNASSTKDSAAGGNVFQVKERPVETRELSQGNNDGVNVETSMQKPEMSKEIGDSLETASEEIVQVVKDVLQLTDEEMEELMAQMGITGLALLDISTLQQFVLTATDHTDVSEMLTDEGLAGTFQELVSQLEELGIADSLGITQEQLAGLVQEAVDKGPEAFKDLFAQVAMDTGVSDEAELVKGRDDEEEPVFTVQSTAQDSDSETVVIKNPSMQEKTSDSESSQSGLQSGHQDKHQGDDKVSPWQNFTQGLVQAAGETTATQASGRMAQMIDIVNQIIEQVKVNLTRETTSMEIQLNPESLGKVNLTVSAKEGVMVANFAVQTEMAKEALESQMHILKEQFDQKGIKVEAVEVTVTDFAFAQSDQTEGGNQGEQQKKAKGKTISMEELQKEMEADEENEDAERTAAIGSGGNIDYTV